MDNKGNKNIFSNSKKNKFNYFEYYIVDNNTISRFPLWGRILLTLTYIEDAVSIILKWDEHVQYYGVKIFLIINAIGLLLGSIATFHKVTIKFGVFGLIGVEIVQFLLFKQLFNLSFYIKLLCNAGGLLLLVAEALLTQNSETNKILLFEQPKVLRNVDSNLQKKIVLLEKCVIILYTLSTFLSNEFNIFIVLSGGFTTIALGLIIFGANNVNSISYFIFILSILNLAINNFWSSNGTLYFTKFQIGQALSTLSGIILLVCKDKKNE